MGSQLAKNHTNAMTECIESNHHPIDPDLSNRDETVHNRGTTMPDDAAIAKPDVIDIPSPPSPESAISFTKGWYSAAKDRYGSLFPQEMNEFMYMIRANLHSVLHPIRGQYVAKKEPAFKAYEADMSRYSLSLLSHVHKLHDYAIRCYREMGRGYVMILFASHLHMVQGNDITASYQNVIIDDKDHFTYRLCDPIRDYDPLSEVVIALVCNMMGNAGRAVSVKWHRHDWARLYLPCTQFVQTHAKNDPHLTLFWTEMTAFIKREDLFSRLRFAEPEECAALFYNTIVLPLPKKHISPHPINYHWYANQKIRELRRSLSYRCAQCQKSCTYVDLKKCSGCRRVAYCSTSCQHDHWGKHKFNCGVIDNDPMTSKDDVRPIKTELRQRL